MNNSKFIKISTTIICILMIMIICYMLIPKGISNDMFFDIKTGEGIIKHGIDFQDHFSFIPNLTYIYHHYLFDIIVYGIYSSFSYFGLSILFTIVATLFGITVFFVCKKYTNNKLIAFITFLLTFYLARFNFNMRIQSITYLLFYLQLFFSEQLYTKGEKKYVILILLNSILIANLHMPLWVFSVILFLPFLVEVLIAKFSKKVKAFELFKPEKTSSLVIITFILLLFIGLFTPLREYPYIFFIKSLFNEKYLIITEMQKTQLFYEVPLILMLVFIVISSYLKIIKIKFRDLLLIMGLFVFVLIANRNVIYFYLFVPTIFVKSIDIKCNFSTNIIDKINFKIVNTITILILSSIYVFSIYSFNYKKYDYELEYYPVKTAKYIKNNFDYKNIKLYNDFNYGSYLLFEDIPVFIDSRAEVYIKEFNGGKDIIGDYIKSWDYTLYKEVFNKYEFDYAIVYKGNMTYNFLKKDSDFKLIYNEKDIFVLFKRINFN